MHFFLGHLFSLFFVKIFFFQNAPCKHPIIILKDTLREEAQAMLEFAYTGEVNILHQSGSRNFPESFGTERLTIK